MPSENPFRDEMLALLRRADCHYGNTLRDEEAGRSVEEAARRRSVKPERIVELRERIRVVVVDREVSGNKTRAEHEAAILRALLHFRSVMSDGLLHQVKMRIVDLKTEFLPDLEATPLQCTKWGANVKLKAVSHDRVCDCGLTHAGEC